MTMDVLTIYECYLNQLRRIKCAIKVTLKFDPIQIMSKQHDNIQMVTLQGPHINQDGWNAGGHCAYYQSRSFIPWDDSFAQLAPVSSNRHNNFSDLSKQGHHCYCLRAMRHWDVPMNVQKEEPRVYIGTCTSAFLRDVSICWSWLQQIDTN